MSGTSENQTTATMSEPTTVTRYTYRYHNDSLNILNVLLLALVVLVAALGLFILVQISTKPSPLHFRLNNNLQIIDPVPLDQQGITTPALINWVNEFMMKAFSFNYSNSQKQISKLDEYLSEAAMKIYTEMLASNEDFQSIYINKFVVAVTPRSAPEILVAKAFKDRYAWQILLPVTITFSNALLKANLYVDFNFLVWRVPESESDLGIKIATFTRRITGRTGIQGLKASNL